MCCGSDPTGFLTNGGLPSGKLLHNHGKSPFLMGKLPISTGPFSSSQTVSLPEGNHETMVQTSIFERIIPNSKPVGFQSLGPGTGDTKKRMPRETGTVLEPCWNLSLLGCKAGQMEIMIICISRTTNNIIEDSATTYGEVPQT